PVLESVLQKSNQNQGGDQKIIGVAALDVKFNGDLIVQSQPLQADVVFHVFDLLGQGDQGVVGVVDHVPHHLRKPRDDFRGLVRLRVSQVVKVIQCVEQEVGVDLRLEEVQLRRQPF